MALLLNWFAVELSPKVLCLPVRAFPTSDEATAALRTELSGYDCHRPRLEPGASAKIVVLHGPAAPHGAESSTFNTDDDTPLTSRIIQNSLEALFHRRGASTRRAFSSLECLWRAEEHMSGRVHLSTGIRVKVHRPSRSGAYGVVVSWAVSAEFAVGLDDAELRGAATRLGVVLRRSTDWRVPEDLARYRGKYLGVVDRVISGSEVSVEVRGGASRVFPSGALALEASPATMHELERRTGARYPVRRLQELSFVLTKDGRRNSSVLRDRLSAVCARLSSNGSSALVVPMRVFGGGKLAIDLRPAELGAEARP